MKNSTYWRKRFDEIAQIQFDKADEAEKELIKAYQKADLYIKERICLYYERYAKDYVISLYDSEKLLSVSELDDFRMTLEEFKEKAVNNQDEKWTRELEEEYLRSRISRLQALKFEINNKIKELKHEQDKINIPHLKDVYSDTFYRTAYELEKGTGIGVNFGKLNDKTIEKAIYTKWLNNKNFAGRMDDNKANLISNLDKIITQGMILGSSSDEMVQKLMKATKVSRSRAINLIQTETTYIIGRANTDMYKEFGVKEYDVIETLDSVTCETCAAMDSKRFKVSEKMEGVNAPPFHPRCRGTTVPVSKYEDIWGKDDRIARDENGVTYYKTEVGDMSYEEYMEYKGITKEFTKTPKSSIKGLSAGDTILNIPEHPEPELLEKIDISDEKNIISTLERYEKDIVDDKVENAIVVLKTGEVYKCFGDESHVWPNIDLAGKLEDAYITHNHPIKVTEFSFSSDDLNMFIDEKLALLRGIDRKYIYEFNKKSMIIDSDINLEYSEESNRHLKNIRMAKALKFGYRRWKNE